MMVIGLRLCGPHELFSLQLPEGRTIEEKAIEDYGVAERRGTGARPEGPGGQSGALGALISDRKEITEDEHGGETATGGDFFNRERMDPRKGYDTQRASSGY
ncbi:hypothetical protein BBJ28_00013354 [Nothophytophthora sp. Chile5]|nr:hypothetical protein BBJ28_00013354 [Nothophytophthora sp. Chile5]